MKRFKDAFRNKNFKSFFARFLFFAIILISEILILTISIGYSQIYLGKWMRIIVHDNIHYFFYIFAIIFFIISIKKLSKLKKINKLYIGKIFCFAAINLIAYGLFFRLSYFFYKNPEKVASNQIFYSVLWILLVIVIGLSLFFAFFDLKFLKYFFKNFRNELAFSGFISLVFLILLHFWMKLWPLFSRISAKLVYWLLLLFFPATYQLKDGLPSVGIPALTLRIHAPCSGIEGMAIFLILFTVLVLFDYEKFNNKKVILLYFLGITGAYMINILRTFSIYIAGHFTTKEFAVGAFHSNVGWIAFTLYFLIFVYFAYPWMKKK